MAKRTKAAKVSDTALTLDAWRQREGLRDEDAFMAFCEDVDGSCATLCTEGCSAEPDGHCEHGNESVLLAAGLI